MAGDPGPADRGFGHVGFLASLQGLVRQLGRRTSFVIRLHANLTVEHQGRRCLLGEWPLEPGRGSCSCWLAGVQLRQDQAFRVNLVLWWREGQKEPWYLATDLTDPQEVIRFYTQRVWIDEMFRDLKSYLGLEASGVKGGERLERLLLGLALAYLVLALVGLYAVRGFAQQVVSWGKASFFFLALAYYEAHGPPRDILHRKGVS